MFTVAGFRLAHERSCVMTIAPDRLEDLDFESWPTLDEVLDAPTGTVVDGLVPAEMIPSLAPALTAEDIYAAVARTRQEVAMLAPTPAEVGMAMGRMFGASLSGVLGAPVYEDRDWVCYCSPSRSMALEHQAHIAYLNRRARRARRRANIAVCVSAVSLILSLVFLLV